MRKVLVTVNDIMQLNFEYFLTEEPGRNFHHNFRPDLTPEALLKLGVFGGKYMTDCGSEFPECWYDGAKLCHERHDPELNFFKINASSSLDEWRQKGWICSDDPRGWFQWYCRYYQGRRSFDDERQIRRWLAMRRHLSQLINACDYRDLNCRRRQRQALLHWAYDTRRC